MAKPYTIAAVQMLCTNDPADNLERAIAHIREAARLGATVISLPELFLTQYFCQREDAALFDLAESIPGPTTARLAPIAHELKVSIIASLFERRAAGLYHNTTAVIDDEGNLAGVYRKNHIPDDPLFYEKYYFTPGDLGYKNFPLGDKNVGVLICWDQWYPEAARLTALAGSNVLFYPTAIGWHPSEKAEWGERQYDAWRTIQRSHAIANGLYVAAVNRVGHETGDIRGDRAEGDGLEFWGGSFIADPFGRILAQAGHDKEEILIAEVNERKIEHQRRNWPFLRDRRIDNYAPILNRFNDMGVK